MKEKNKVRIKRIAWVLFCIYMAGLFYFLFLSERYGRTSTSEEYRYNLVLFKEIKRYIQYRNLIGMESFVVNIFGNILAFAPFGLVLPIISRNNKSILNVTLMSLELTLTIEILQLIFKVGIFDVDDILMNTFGAVLGYLIYCVGYSVYRRITRSRRK